MSQVSAFHLKFIAAIFIASMMPNVLYVFRVCIFLVNTIPASSMCFGWLLFSWRFGMSSSFLFADQCACYLCCCCVLQSAGNLPLITSCFVCRVTQLSAVGWGRSSSVGWASFLEGTTLSISASSRRNTLMQFKQNSLPYVVCIPISRYYFACHSWLLHSRQSVDKNLYVYVWTKGAFQIRRV